MRRLRWMCGFAAVLVPCLSAQQTPASSAAAGQDTAPVARPEPRLIPRSHEERERRYQAEHRIILNVHVTDALDRPVPDLQPSDFALIDAGHPETIASLRPVDGAMAAISPRVILMLDAVNNSARGLKVFRAAVERFLKLSDAPFAVPVSIATFTADGTTIGESTHDRQILLSELETQTDNAPSLNCDRKAIQRQELPSNGMPGGRPYIEASGLLECKNRQFTLSVSSLMRLADEEVDIPGAVVLVWIGQGWPLLTDRGFAPDTPEIKQSFYDNLVQVTKVLREAQITLDVVGTEDALKGSGLLPEEQDALLEAIPTQDQIVAASLSLPALAHRSGGQVLVDPKEIAGNIARCVEDAVSFYALSFNAPPVPELGEFRSLQVKVNRPGVTVRTNTLYYAEP